MTGEQRFTHNGFLLIGFGLGEGMGATARSWWVCFLVFGVMLFAIVARAVWDIFREPRVRRDREDRSSA